jgi:hypothetical protein
MTRSELDNRLIELKGWFYFLRHGGGWRSEVVDICYDGYDKVTGVENWMVIYNCDRCILYTGCDHDEIIAVVKEYTE